MCDWVRWQTLDVFQMICRNHGFPFVRLDGTTAVKKRQKIVDAFNDPASHQVALPRPTLLFDRCYGLGAVSRSLQSGQRVAARELEVNSTGEEIIWFLVF